MDWIMAFFKKTSEMSVDIQLYNAAISIDMVPKFISLLIYFKRKQEFQAPNKISKVPSLKAENALALWQKSLTKLSAFE